MSVTGILGQIKSIIAGVTGVGKVYTFRRWVPQDKDFQNAVVTGNRINFWDIYRANSEERWPNEFQFQRVHNIVVRGFLSAKDASASEQEFQSIVERVSHRFRLKANRTLNGTVESLGSGDLQGLHLSSIDYGMVHNALCHVVQGRITVIEKPTNVLSGATAAQFKGPRIFFKNEITDPKQLSSLSIRPGFPLSFMIDESPKTVWRSKALDTPESGAPYVQIDIDLGASKNIRAFAVKNHNFGAGTYRLFHGISQSTLVEITNLLSKKTPEQWVSFFPTITARYWRFIMQEALQPSGFFQIGELWLGNVLDLNKWHEENSEIITSDRRQHETDGGQRWRLSGFQRRSRAYSFRNIDQDGDWVSWQTIFRDRGQEHPLYFTVNPAVPSSSFFCTIKQALTERNVQTNKINLAITLDEEL